MTLPKAAHCPRSVHTLAPVELNVFAAAAQDKHADWPVDGLYVPAGQEMQFLVAKFQPGR